MKRTLLYMSVLTLAMGCTTESRSPDAIRQDTAKATAEATRDAKAVAEDVVDGLREKGPININKAKESDLDALPGLDTATADKIIAGRPYTSSIELVKRHIISKGEYDRIANKIVAR